MNTKSANDSTVPAGAHIGTDLERLAQWALVALVTLRIAGSWNWINGAFFGKDKKIAPDFLSGAGVTSRVESFFGKSGALYPSIADFLNTTVVNNAAFFGWLILAGELVAGICLLLGLFTRLGGLAATLSAVLNFMAAAGGGGDSIGQNYLLLLLGLIFMVVPAGRYIGLDGVLQRRSNARILRILG